MATRERLARTSNMKYNYSTNGNKRTPGSNDQYGKHTSSINCQKRTPGSNEQYGIQKYGIHKLSINGHKRTPGSNEQYGIHTYSTNGHKNAWLKRAKWKTLIFNKWPQNAWLKRAIWNTQICNKWPQETGLAQTGVTTSDITASNLDHFSSKLGFYILF